MTTQAKLGDLGQLALHVYHKPETDRGVPAGYTLLDTSNNIGVTSSNGYYGEAYRNTATGEVVIVSRGMRADQATDRKMVETVLSGAIPESAKDAIAFAQYVRLTYGDDVVCVGHSLGGYAAQMQNIALANAGARSSAVSIDALALNLTDRAVGYIDGTNYDAKNFYTKADPATNLTLAQGLRFPGQSIALDFGPNALTTAGSCIFAIDALETRVFPGVAAGVASGLMCAANLISAHGLPTLLDGIAGNSSLVISSVFGIATDPTVSNTSVLTLQSILDLTGSGQSIARSLGLFYLNQRGTFGDSQPTADTSTLTDAWSQLLQGVDTTDAQLINSNGTLTVVLPSGEMYSVNNQAQTSTFTAQETVDGGTLWTNRNFDGASNTITTGLPDNTGSLTTAVQSFDSNGLMTQSTVAVVDGQGNPVSLTETRADANVGENTVSQIVTIFDAEGLAESATVEQSGNGSQFNISFAYDQNGDPHVSSVNSINGLAPIDGATAVAALNEQGVLPDTFSSGTLSGQVEGTLRVFDATDSIGWQPPDTATPNNPYDAPWWKNPGAEQFGGALTSAQSIISALKSGNGLAIATSISAAVARFDGEQNPSLGDLASNVAAISDLVGFRNALDHGDLLGSLRSGLSLSNFALTQYKSVLNVRLGELQSTIFEPDFAGDFAAALSEYRGLGGELTTVNSALDGIGAALTVVNVLVNLEQGNVLGVAVALASLEVPVIGWIYAGIQIFQMIFNDDSPPPVIGDAWISGSGADGKTLSVQAVGQSGGEGPANQMMSQLLDVMKQTIEDLPNHGFVAERLPTLHYDGQWTLNCRDPVTNQSYQRTFDMSGGYVAETRAGAVDGEVAYTDDFFKNILEQYVEAAYKMGAIVPDSELATIAQQRARGDTLMGFTTLQRAALAGTLLAALPEGDAVAVRPIVLDLDGNGINVTPRDLGGSVLFDYDDDGFAEETDWVNPRDGILALDRNGDGKIAGGHEIFNDGRVDNAARGLNALAEIDGNGDGVITSGDSGDAVFGDLRVWRDVNMDGVAQDSELQGLSTLGITSLDYTTGAFLRDGESLTMGQAQLSASASGVTTKFINGHLWVMGEDGGETVYASSVGDLTQADDGLSHQGASADGKLLAGDDLIETFEDTTVRVNVAQFLANDVVLDPGIDPNSLRVYDNLTASHGAVTYNNGVIEFTPEDNYFGDGGFDYTVTDGDRLARGHVQVGIASVNDLPEAENAFKRTPLHLEDLYSLYSDSGYALPPDTELGDPVDLASVAILPYTVSGAVLGLSENNVIYH